MKKLFTIISLLAICAGTQAQNVGIGTTTPGTKLTVFGFGPGIEQTDGTVSIKTVIGSGYGYLGTISNHPMHLSANNTLGQLVVMPTGIIGIGTSTATLAGLVVDKKIGAANAIFGSNTTGVAIESSNPGIGLNSYYSSGRKFIAAGYGGVMGFDPATGGFVFASSTASGTAGAALNSTNVMTISNAGSTQIQGADAGYIFNDRSDNSYGGWNWYASGGTAKLYRYTSGGDLLAITAAGRVGIGTVSPAAKLDVNGNTVTVGLSSTVSGGLNAVSATAQNGAAVNAIATGTGTAGQFTSAGGPALVTVLGNTGLGTSTPNSTLQVSGSLSLPITVVTTDYTVTDLDYLIYVGTKNQSNLVTVNLPIASDAYIGRMYRIVMQTANSQVVVKINGVQIPDPVLYTSAINGGNIILWRYGATFQCNSTKWVVIQNDTIIN